MHSVKCILFCPMVDIHVRFLRWAHLFAMARNQKKTTIEFTRCKRMIMEAPFSHVFVIYCIEWNIHPSNWIWWSRSRAKQILFEMMDDLCSLYQHKMQPATSSIKHCQWWLLGQSLGFIRRVCFCTSHVMQSDGRAQCDEKENATIDERWRNQTIVESRWKQMKSNEATSLIGNSRRQMNYDVNLDWIVCVCFFPQLYTRFNNLFTALHIKPFEMMCCCCGGQINGRKTDRFLVWSISTNEPQPNIT